MPSHVVMASVVVSVTELFRRDVLHLRKKIIDVGADGFDPIWIGRENCRYESPGPVGRDCTSVVVIPSSVSEESRPPFHSLLPSV